MNASSRSSRRYPLSVASPRRTVLLVLIPNGLSSAASWGGDLEVTLLLQAAPGPKYKAAVDAELALSLERRAYHRLRYVAGTGAETSAQPCARVKRPEGP